jgi:hypothetical protein
MINGIAPRSMSIGRPLAASKQRSGPGILGRTLPAGYIHLGVAKEFVPVLRDFGIDPDPVIREVGLAPRLFEDGANVIPYVALGKLCSLSVARTNCPILGFWSVNGRRYCLLG